MTASITSSKAKKFTYFIGIDVSKNELDYAVIYSKNLIFHRETKNKLEEIHSFIGELKTLPNFTMTKSIFCMEETGIYCNHLLTYLKKVNANIVLENALQIKRSLGIIRGKNDKIDAVRIAKYAFKNKDELKIWLPKRSIVTQLSSLFSLRNRMLSLQVAMNAPLKEQTTFIKEGVHKKSLKLCKNSVKAIKLDLAAIDANMDQLIASDEHLKKIFKIITSVPYVGRITAIQVIISTNEFKDIKNPKKFACYAGVAPFKMESGVTKGKASVSHIANKRVKTLLHICAMGAIRGKGELGEYYIRKTQNEGRPKMLVINSIRNKLILRIFACLNQDRLFEQDYIRDITLEQNENTN